MPKFKTFASICWREFMISISGSPVRLLPAELIFIRMYMQCAVQAAGLLVHHYRSDWRPANKRRWCKFTGNSGLINVLFKIKKKRIRKISKALNSGWPSSDVPVVLMFQAGASVPVWYHVPMFQVFRCSGLVQEFHAGTMFQCSRCSGVPGWC